MNDSESRPRRVGRPRDTDIEQRLRDAALHILQYHDAAALTVDRVCEVAGVSRATFYRRWRTIAPIVVGLARFLMEEVNPRTSSTGTLKGDMLQDLTNLATLLASPSAGRLFRYIFTEVSTNGEYRTLVDDVVKSREVPTTQAVRSAIERGEVRPEIEPGFVTYQLAGPLWHRRLLLQLPLTPEFIDQVVDSVIRGIVSDRDQGSGAPLPG